MHPYRDAPLPLQRFVFGFIDETGFRGKAVRPPVGYIEEAILKFAAYRKIKKAFVSPSDWTDIARRMNARIEYVTHDQRVCAEMRFETPSGPVLLGIDPELN